MFYFLITITILLPPINPQYATDPIHHFRVWSKAQYRNGEECTEAIQKAVEYIHNKVPNSRASIEASCYPTGVQEL